MLLALATALVLPTSALAYDWTKSPVNPLVKGGVHSTAKFKSLMSSNSKVRSALRGVIKADKYPGWVFSAATKQAAAGNVHSSSLKRGARIGAMAFGLKKTKIIKNTIWKGKGRLPYYYVDASRTVVESGYNVTTTFKVSLSKTCANPFVMGRRVTRTPVLPQPPATHTLRARVIDGSGNPVSEWQITGQVGTETVDAVTGSDGSIDLGSFAPGTEYNLAPSLSGGVIELEGSAGHTGTMPDSDLTLTFLIDWT